MPYCPIWHGEQRLLDERYFPPALLFANPRFFCVPATASCRAAAFLC